MDKRIAEQLPNLKTLVLTSNHVKELGDLEGLSGCGGLEHLSLLENPVTRKEVSSGDQIPGSTMLMHGDSTTDFISYGQYRRYDSSTFRRYARPNGNGPLSCSEPQPRRRNWRQRSQESRLGRSMCLEQERMASLKGHEGASGRG